jgi:predicted AAA+ superfamily ATPase
MDKGRLRQVIIDQQESFNGKENLIAREVDMDYCLKGNEIVVISGIRRCGKSSLLKLLAERVPGAKLFLDFDDVRLADFEVANYQDVEDIAFELCKGKVSYFLDEIQNAPLWARWVNNLYSKGVKLFITGSNSTLLSSEISTFLTGRNKQVQLSTFSFSEFLALKGLNYDMTRLSSPQKAEIFRNFGEYFRAGGFPLVVRNDDLSLSRQYFDDMLNKDVIGRYRIREVKELKDLVLFLLSNVGKRYSYSKLRQVSGIRSLSTVKNFIEYFENAFILHKVELFDYSVRKQKVASSKVYAGDNSFLKTVAFNFTENLGQRLENLVFLQLERLGAEVYYHADKHECDFITKQGLKVDRAIQVTVSLGDPKTKEREVDGLFDAMRRYKLDRGLIITLEEEGVIDKGQYRIVIAPAWKWLLEDGSGVSRVR